jgi:peptidoglycan/LPS O-acetylase OafA/YrhL
MVAAAPNPGTGLGASSTLPGHSSGTEPVITVPRAHYATFEGLRAMAAVMVVVHHAASIAGPDATSRWVRVPAEVMDGGVAVFFVLSGFLIYRPFALRHRSGTAAPPTVLFWWRRIVRLVPAYWLALTFFWFLGAFDLGDDWWRYYLFLQTYSRTTTLGGLVQAWSLGTEVAFYLLIPVWAGAISRLLPRRALAGWGDLAGCGLLYVMALAARQLISSANPTWRGLSFQWLPTNLDLFAVGMAVAVLSVHAAEGGRLGELTARLARPAVAWWAAAIGLFAWYAVRVGPPSGAMLADPNGAYTGIFWQQRQFVLGLFTALILVPAVFGDDTRGLVPRVLRCRPIAWIGAMSFGIYLWHFDWMKRAVPRTNGITGEQLWPGWGELPGGTLGFWYILAIGLGIGCVAAALSWSLLEQPLQRHRDLVRRRGPINGGSSAD